MATHNHRNDQWIRPWTSRLLHSRHASKTAVLVVAIVAGFTFMAGAVNSKGSELRPAGGDTASLVADRADRVSLKRARAHALQASIDRLSNHITDDDIEEDRDSVEALQPKAGMTDVDGSAVRVTLTDAPKSVKAEPGMDPNALVVHQQDIQAVVNALWSGGARAITLQGQRLISTTGVKCVGNTVVLDGVPYSPPYVIEAIGDPNGLRFALSTSPTVSIYRQYAQKYKLGLDVEVLEHAKAGAYSSGVSLNYAQIAD